MNKLLNHSYPCENRVLYIHSPSDGFFCCDVCFRSRVEFIICNICARVLSFLIYGLYLDFCPPASFDLEEAVDDINEV